jgi:galactose oxidase-like protein
LYAQLLPVTRPIALGLLAVACAATPSPMPATAPPGSPSPAPTEYPTPIPGQRRFVVAVNNGSGRPATLVVGNDGMFNGHPTGTVDPSILPPGITEDVILGIPPSDGWAIYVNPGPDWGPSITWRDVPPDAAGRMPFTIVIADDGSGAADANPPGWFGNPSQTPGPRAATSPPPAIPLLGWTATGEMHSPRRDHTATLLSDGRVLVAGGSDDYHTLALTELYDPASGSWTAVGRLAVARSGHTATLLTDGTVLVAGGYDRSDRILDSTETFDPSTGTWSASGKMVTAVTAHTATLLPDGRVLVAGGSAFGGHGQAVPAAEVYDPASRSWTATKRMIDARWGHTATLLPNGRVLIAGGFADLGSLASAELYNPSNGSWTATGSMDAGRAKFTATLLLDGTVLVAGLGGSRSVELYDPDIGSWAATGKMEERRANYPTATRLLDGRVLLTGGGCGCPEDALSLASAEVYDPARRSWVLIDDRLSVRSSHTATLLLDGRVLMAGGRDVDGAVVSADLFDPVSGT